MKTEYKAILASIIVIALALTAVSTVTYSWFSDTDSSDITISTATVDVELDIDDTISVSGYGSATAYSNGNIGISNFAANSSFSGTYTVNNNSTIDIVYRVSVQMDATGNNAILPYILVGTSSGDATAMSNGTLDGSTRSVSIGGWQNMAVGTATSEPANFYIAFSEDMPSLSTGNISMRMVIEAYQGDYEIPIEDGQAVITEDNPVVTGDVPLSGGEPDQTVETTVSFDNTAAKTVSGQTLKIEATSGGSDAGFTVNNAVTLDLSMNDAETTDFGSGVVTVTTTVAVASEPTTVNVIYNGVGEQPTVTGWSWDDGALTVTFTTSHFSEFVVVTGDETIVTTETALIASLKSGMNVTLGADISRTITLGDLTNSGYPCADAILIRNGGSLDLAGHTLTNFNMFVYSCEFSISDSDGNGKMVYDENTIPDIEKPIETSPYIIFGYFVYVAYGGEAIINSGNFDSNDVGCVYVEKGTATINGGNFDATGENIRFTLNLYDANGKNGTANIVVNGGSFVNYDPTQSNSENPVKNFVAPGKGVERTETSGNYVYTVVDATTVTTAEELRTAMNNGDAVILGADITDCPKIAVDPNNVSSLDAKQNYDAGHEGDNEVYAFLDFNGYMITCAVDNYWGIQACTGATVVLIDSSQNKSGGITATAPNDGNVASVKFGGQMYILDGNYTSAKNSACCIYVCGNGNITIHDGVFSDGSKDDNYGGLLNIFNSSASYTVSGTITVYGGEFVGYDPSTGDDIMGGNFVASGKKVTEENGVYTVA